MRRWLPLLIACLLQASLLACAPRQAKTHYTRWAEETEKRKQEEAAAEAAEAEATAAGAGKTPAPAAKRATPPPSNYSSLPPNDTPEITETATRARVVKPEEPKPDDDVIY